MKNLALLFAAFITFPCAPLFSDEPKAATKPAAATTTPAKKKKKGELEAEEEPAVLDRNDRSRQMEESYRVPQQILGTWEAAGRRLFIKDGGAYTISGAETDAGFIHASLGLLHRRSNRDRQWVEGRYFFRGIEALEFDGAFTPREWKRVK